MDSPLSSSEMVARYEELRYNGLSGPRLTQNLGLAVFCHRGMAAWMKVWADYVPAEKISGSRTVVQHADEANIPAGIQGDMVRVLAGMIFGVGRKEIQL